MSEFLSTIVTWISDYILPRKRLISSTQSDYIAGMQVLNTAQGSKPDEQRDASTEGASTTTHASRLTRHTSRTESRARGRSCSPSQLERYRSHDSHTHRTGRDYRSDYKKAKQQLDEATQRYGANVELYNGTTSRLRAERNELKTERDRLRSVAEKAEQQVELLRKQLERERGLREDDAELLEIRRRELQDAEAFLGSADTVSGEEILSMVQALNSDILQLAACIAESGQFSSSYQCKPDWSEAAQQLLGASFCEFLSSAQGKHPDDRELIIQVATQSVLVGRCIDFSGDWNPSLKTPNLLESVYQEIRTQCSQRVAGRWRSLTRSCWKYRDSAGIESMAVNNLIRSLSLGLHVLGHKYALDDWGRTRSYVKSEYGRALNTIANGIMKLDRALGEQLVSQDLALEIAPQGALFEPKAMDDSYGDPRSPSGPNEVVACTVELGVGRFGQGEAAEREMLLKPKVALMSTLTQE